MDVEEPQIPYRYQLVVDEAHRRRIARAIIGRLFRRPVVWALFGVMVLLGLALIASGSGPWYLIAPVLFLGILALNGIGIVRRLARAAPDGAVQRSGFSDDAVRVGLDGTSSTFPIERIASIERRHDLVWVTLQPVKQRLIWGAELFPDQEIARIRAAISARSAAAGVSS